MANTTATKVKGIMNITIDDSEVTPYITSANAFLNSLSLGVSDGLMTEIETWLAAHYLALVRYRVSTKEKAGTAEIQYADVYGENLSATQYGQTAIVMDTTGKLQQLSGKKKKASIFVLPTNNE